jgi:hypothetical protein
MTRRSWWLIHFHSLFLLWHECGEEFAVFCYRISEGVLVSVGQHAVVAIQKRRGEPGTGPACSNPSANLFTRSMM